MPSGCLWTASVRLADGFLDDQVGQIVCPTITHLLLAFMEVNSLRAATQRCVLAAHSATHHALTGDGRHIEGSLPPHDLVVLSGHSGPILLLLSCTCVDVADSQEHGRHAEQGQRSWNVVYAASNTVYLGHYWLEQEQIHADVGREETHQQGVSDC